MPRKNYRDKKKHKEMKLLMEGKTRKIILRLEKELREQKKDN